MNIRSGKESAMLLLDQEARKQRLKDLHSRVFKESFNRGRVALNDKFFVDCVMYALSSPEGVNSYKSLFSLAADICSLLSAAVYSGDLKADMCDETDFSGYLDTTFSDKYCNGRYSSDLYVYGTDIHFQLGNSSKYIQRYFTEGFSKSKNITDLYKAYHYIIFALSTHPEGWVELEGRTTESIVNGLSGLQYTHIFIRDDYSFDFRTVEESLKNTGTLDLVLNFSRAQVPLSEVCMYRLTRPIDVMTLSQALYYYFGSPDRLRANGFYDEAGTPRALIFNCKGQYITL